MRTSKEFREATDPSALKALGALRRMAISLTARALWQLAGFKLPDGGQEAFNAEPFTGIGIAARPPANGAPEAIVVMIGGARSPAIIAVRDEKTRAAIAGALAQDETATFNSKSIFVHKADGTMEARSANGTPAELSHNADLAKLVSILSGVTGGVGAGDAAIAALQTYLGTHLNFPVGTTKLKGE